ncbi:Protein of unknown function [Gryllus bimaculatus]|nr:Protein of unknown function [Gryllus bimaculatus]
MLTIQLDFEEFKNEVEHLIRVAKEAMGLGRTVEGSGRGGRYSCGYFENFQEYGNFVQQTFPGIVIEGQEFNPSSWWVVLANAFDVPGTSEVKVPKYQAPLFLSHNRSDAMLEKDQRRSISERASPSKRCRRAATLRAAAAGCSWTSLRARSAHAAGSGSGASPTHGPTAPARRNLFVQTSSIFKNQLELVDAPFSCNVLVKSAPPSSLTEATQASIAPDKIIWTLTATGSYPIAVLINVCICSPALQCRAAISNTAHARLTSSDGDWEPGDASVLSVVREQRFESERHRGWASARDCLPPAEERELALAPRWRGRWRGRRRGRGRESEGGSAARRAAAPEALWSRSAGVSSTSLPDLGRFRARTGGRVSEDDAERGGWRLRPLAARGCAAAPGARLSRDERDVSPRGRNAELVKWVA